MLRMLGVNDCGKKKRGILAVFEAVIFVCLLIVKMVNDREMGKL